MKIQRVAVDERRRLVEEENGDECAVYGGKNVTTRTIDQLGVGAVVQSVERMLGGGKKKK